MNKRKETEWKQRTELQKAGWDVSKTDSVQFNSGSETARHFHGKCVVAYFLRDNRWRVDSEVVHDERGEIDILAYGRDGFKPQAFEIETEVSEAVVSDKIDRYVRGTPISECYVLEATEIPLHFGDAYEHVANQL